LEGPGGGQQRVPGGAGAVRAFGFSPDGRFFVVATSADVTAFALGEAATSHDPAAQEGAGHVV
jgi:hypothetical protein